MITFTILNNEKYALKSVFCKWEAAFSHLSGGGTFRRFFQLGHLDLLHTAHLDSSTFFYKVEPVVSLVTCLGWNQVLGDMLCFQPSDCDVINCCERGAKN